MLRVILGFAAPLFAAATMAASTLDSVRKSGQEAAVFAGGCFWCVESDFDGVPGVLETISGYTGGTLDNPTYRDVTAGGTGHREAVLIVYDPKQVSYDHLLHVFWRSVDPTDGGGQFCDRGVSYRTAIFTRDAAQADAARKSKAELESSGVLKDPVATTIEPLGEFYPAEGYHQDYYRKSPVRYKLYRYSCGRDRRIESLWGEQAHSGIETH